jgi:hypothetical protein
MRFAYRPLVADRAIETWYHSSRMKTAMFVAPYLEYQVRVSRSRRGRAK